MPNFAGFDRDLYPGDAAMQAIIQNTNLRWCGFYLAPAPSHLDQSWMTKCAFLKGLGFGLAPIYVGQQVQGPGSHNVTAAQGTIDGQNAAQLASQAAFGNGSIIFLDIEQGPPIQPATIAYYVAWVAGVTANGFAPGVYCSHAQLPQALFNADNRPVFWIFNLNHFTCDPSAATSSRILIPRNAPFPAPDPASGGVSFAKLLQFAQSIEATKCGINAGGSVVLNVDFDSSVASDPSNPATYP
jgi:Rv2525c-like, glycoside hydrolase-like domain